MEEVKNESRTFEAAFLVVQKQEREREREREINIRGKEIKRRANHFHVQMLPEDLVDNYV